MKNSTFVAVRPVIAIAMMAVAALSRAELVANFDDLTEGEVFTTFTNGGIRFYDVSRHQGGFTNFAIEDASTGFPSGSFSPPNTLGFGGYVPGPDYAFGAFGGMWFTSDTESVRAAMDVWTLPLGTGGNTLTLSGYMEETFVASVSQTIDSSFVPLHFRLELPEGEYSRYWLKSTGPSVSGDSFLLVDNVLVGAVPEPVGPIAIAVGIGVLAARRRSRSRV